MNPSSDIISQLQRNNVENLVVDKWNLSVDNWHRIWEVEDENERFLVVKLYLTTITQLLRQETCQTSSTARQTPHR